jgi:hypothetical protein
MKKRTTKKAAVSKKRVASKSKAKRVTKRAKSTVAKKRAKVARKSVFSFWAE